MTSPKQDSPRPEAGADTRQGRQGPAPDERVADSGGTRTPAGSGYGDFVPDRTPPTHRPQAAEEPPGRSPEDTSVPEKEETAVESNRNKSFDTTHVHTGTTTRKV